MFSTHVKAHKLFLVLCIFLVLIEFTVTPPQPVTAFGLGSFVPSFIKKPAKKAVKFVAYAVKSVADRTIVDIRRGLYWINQAPPRISRFLNNFVSGLPSLRRWYTSIPAWLVRIHLQVFEILGFNEALQRLNDEIKLNTRSLTDEEKSRARSVFGDSINLELVRIDGAAIIGPCLTRRAYTSMHLINSCGDMPDWIFIHELTHVWQYEEDGVIYGPEAALAGIFGFGGGYNYGGVERLKLAKEDNKHIVDFNREQEAQIVEDFFHYRNEMDCETLKVYAYFVNDVSTLSESDLIRSGSPGCLSSNITGINGEGDPNNPDDDNACLPGGSLDGKCPTNSNWHWNCGWYLIRVERGELSAQSVPNQYQGCIPQPGSPPSQPVIPGPIPTPTDVPVIAF